MNAKQADLFSLLPGARGGRALRDRRGADYLAQLGATGGATTVRRYGRFYMAALGERGRAAQRQRAELPRTIYRDGAVRIVPWRPHRGSSYYSSRRRRPILVAIELDQE